MRKILLTGMTLFITPAIYNSALAADGPALIEKARCYMCHQQASASLGPPWEAIAARHAARKDEMREVLARKIIHGGGGNWGLVPMVPNQQITVEQARMIADWILERAETEPSGQTGSSPLAAFPAREKKAPVSGALTVCRLTPVIYISRQ